MRFACAFLVLAAVAGGEVVAPAGGVTLKASSQGGALVIGGVYLNGAGPFRMLIDTGNATSIVRPQAAHRLGLKPLYEVEHASAAGPSRAGVALLDEVRVGAVTDRGVEAVIGDVYLAGVDGVLGQSWLARHDYLLDFRGRTLGIDTAPAGGSRSALRSVDGRPVVSAVIEGRERELVVDSGANVVVLYEKTTRGGEMTQVATNSGTAPAERCAVRVALAGARERRFNAVRIDVEGLGPGLLPASAFDSVFVSNRQGFVEFRR